MSDEPDSGTKAEAVAQRVRAAAERALKGGGGTARACGRSAGAPAREGRARRSGAGALRRLGGERDRERLLIGLARVRNPV